MLDIDEFKRINDRFGHTAGDAALVNAAGILKKAFENTNSFIARYGGDEFAIILHYTSPEKAEEMLLKIESEAEAFNRQPNPPPYKLVFSAGFICSDRNRFTSYQDMITAADAHMYIRKQQHKLGR